MKYLTKKTIISLTICLILIPGLCFAQDNNVVKDGLEFIKKPLGLPDFNLIIFASNIINEVLSLAGIIVVVMILFIGFKYMVAMGDEEASANLRRSFVNLIVGVIIVFTSYSIANFVLSSILNAT